MTSKYSITLKWSNDDNCFIAFSKELWGCSTHGDTPEEALKEFKIAKELWLAVMKEDKMLIPQPDYFHQDDIRIKHIFPNTAH